MPVEQSLSLQAIRQITIYPRRKAPAFLRKLLEDRLQCLLSTSASIHVLIDHDLHIPDPLGETLPNAKGSVLQA
jgi:hypothetical protein